MEYRRDKFIPEHNASNALWVPEQLVYLIVTKTLERIRLALLLLGQGDKLLSDKYSPYWTRCTVPNANARGH